MLGNTLRFSLLLVSCTLLSLMVTNVDAITACCVDEDFKCIAEKTDAQCTSAGLTVTEDFNCEVGDLEKETSQEILDQRAAFADGCGGDGYFNIITEN
ncbi:uncharacterized protein EV154DRAFT_516580 [Mucor mucedo]|uniref:uncharacterized protein n=1 Tax=Mucor mucedo TaxID=29922 RepID=UPI00221E4594|nr:uncharacterized protein EV154DRAFT_516580 [Mucor mucedo]KAI7888820.1 hypothetical protein EV154DRAFT_516580 [Mucor mucedo]